MHIYVCNCIYLYVIAHGKKKVTHLAERARAPGISKRCEISEERIG